MNRTRIAMIATGVVAAMSAAANATEEYHLDINDLDAAILAGETSIDVPVTPGQLVDYTGTIQFRANSGSFVLEAEFEDGDRAIVPGQPGVNPDPWFTLTVDLVNGGITGGDVFITDGDNVYTANVRNAPNVQGPVGYMFSAQNGGAKLVGLTFEGLFADVSDTAEFFTIGGIDVFADNNGFLIGTFDELDLGSVVDAEYDVAFQDSITIDLFIQNPAIPVPTAAALATAGFIGLGVRRRR